MEINTYQLNGAIKSEIILKSNEHEHSCVYKKSNRQREGRSNYVIWFQFTHSFITFHRKIQTNLEVQL